MTDSPLMRWVRDRRRSRCLIAILPMDHLLGRPMAGVGGIPSLLFPVYRCAPDIGTDRIRAYLELSYPEGRLVGYEDYDGRPAPEALVRAVADSLLEEWASYERRLTASLGGARGPDKNGRLTAENDK
jgi:hypothetical protein